MNCKCVLTSLADRFRGRQILMSVTKVTASPALISSIMYSFIFSKHFILIRDTNDLGVDPWNTGTEAGIHGEWCSNPFLRTIDAHLNTQITSLFLESGRKTEEETHVARENTQNSTQDPSSGSNWGPCTCDKAALPAARHGYNIDNNASSCTLVNYAHSGSGANFKQLLSLLT